MVGSESEQLDALRAVVKRVWGYEELRPLQAEAMLAALAGRDALVVLPTGGGRASATRRRRCCARASAAWSAR
jgi:Lhr-like helicase